MFSLLQQRHPDVATAEKTYQTAEDYIRRLKFFGEASPDEASGTTCDTAIFLGKRGRREDGKRPRKWQKREMGVKQSAVVSLAKGSEVVQQSLDTVNAKHKVGETPEALPPSYPKERFSNGNAPAREDSRSWCTYCALPGHTEAACRRKRKGLSRMSSAKASQRPTCTACARIGHDESQCWVKYPYLHPNARS